MQTACPSCGAPVEFRYDETFVRVCEYCRCALVRRDRELESLGKVSDLAETPSALALYARGHYRSTAFTVVGHLELAHERGGRFHEWYLRFDDGRWGWLAEAQGRHYLTFRSQGPIVVPELGRLRAGALVTVHDSTGPIAFKLAEHATATRVTAEGEIPFSFVPGEVYRFADFGARDQFATADFGTQPGDRPVLYLGRQIRLEELTLEPQTRAPVQAPVIRSRRLECPSCGASIEHWVPGESLRLTCSYCNRLLDLERGSLAVLSDLVTGTARSPIPLGTTCRFEDDELTVVGFVERAISIDGKAYPFEELLLYAPRLGFRWLVQSDGHYSYVRPIAPGLIDGYRAPHYDGVEFRAFSMGAVSVKRVLGEFYWRVEVGERSEMRDYVAPGAMLTRETTDHEENWTLGTYLTHAEVKAAFSTPFALEPPVGLAPHQPGLPAVERFALVAVLAAVGVLGLFVLLSAATLSRTVLKQWVEWTPSAESSAEPGADLNPEAPAPGTAVWFSPAFELTGRENLEVRFQSTVDNSWQWVQADLVNTDQGDFVSVAEDLEYYHGVDGGESWSEGSPHRTALLSPRPAGHYVVRLETEAGTQLVPGPIGIEVVQGVVPTRLLLYAFAAIGLPFAAIALYIHRVERRRWENSNLVSSSPSSGDSE